MGDDDSVRRRRLHNAIDRGVEPGQRLVRSLRPEHKPVWFFELSTHLELPMRWEEGRTAPVVLLQPIGDLNSNTEPARDYLRGFDALGSLLDQIVPGQNGGKPCRQYFGSARPVSLSLQAERRPVGLYLGNRMSHQDQPAQRTSHSAMLADGCPQTMLVVISCCADHDSPPQLGYARTHSAIIAPGHGNSNGVAISLPRAPQRRPGAF